MDDGHFSLYALSILLVFDVDNFDCIRLIFVFEVESLVDSAVSPFAQRLIKPNGVLAVVIDRSDDFDGFLVDFDHKDNGAMGRWVV